MKKVKENLPLLYYTSKKWAELVLKKPLLLLCDHAHLEKKAALNALNLIGSWPNNEVSQQWIHILSSIAKDESQHLMRVNQILYSKQGSMIRAHKNFYADDLRKQVRKGRHPQELLDKLLISALIEARSCERFYLLSAETTDIKLAKLYSSLWSSEHGHYRVFLELAYFTSSQSEVEARWQWFLEKEAEIIEKQVFGFSMHSGLR